VRYLFVISVAAYPRIIDGIEDTTVLPVRFVSWLFPLSRRGGAEQNKIVSAMEQLAADKHLPPGHTSVAIGRSLTPKLGVA
jgi:hypothetical protein